MIDRLVAAAFPWGKSDVKYLAEYRDAEAVRHRLAQLAALTTRPWTVMEVCGGQTHSFLRFGIDELLPPAISLLHGPGCPVCVTPANKIDQAICLSQLPQVTVCTYGDMLRVRGSREDLLSAKARGGDVRMVYSPLEAVEIASREPEREIVFFAVGFETTIPGTALAVLRARQRGLANFSILNAHVRVPPAVHAILDEPGCSVQGLLAAGHVCTVVGFAEYDAIARDFRVPVVVTGFEPVDLLDGLIECVRQLEQGRATVANCYPRYVRPEGNLIAQGMIREVFEPIDLAWRGFPRISGGGFGLRREFHDFDATEKFDVTGQDAAEVTECIAAEIMRGRKKPGDCPAFGGRCTPLTPLGAPMVSSEGACAAYFRYRPAENKELVHD